MELRKSLIRSIDPIPRIVNTSIKAIYDSSTVSNELKFVFSTIFPGVIMKRDLTCWTLDMDSTCFTVSGKYLHIMTHRKTIPL